MKIFVSFVGFQPAAIATALKGWGRAKGPPEKVIFLFTEATREITRRLASKLQEWNLYQQIKPIPVSETNHLAQEVAGATEIVFYADPGLKFQVVQAYFRYFNTATLLHADAEKLRMCRLEGGRERWEELESVDLGLEQLLALHEMMVVPGSSSLHPTLQRCLEEQHLLPLPPLIRKNPRFMMRDGWEIAPFALTYECRGWLYGLAVVDPTTPEERLHQMRDLISLAAKGLQGLQPRVAVLSPDEYALQRAREGRLLPIRCQTRDGKKRLEAWVAGNPPLPGRVPLKTALPSGSFSLPSTQGQGGSGPPLVGCVGADPSATLLTLVTHRPKRALIFYDHQTLLIQEIAARLHQEMGSLPVGSVEFIPTDHLGRQVLKRLELEAKKPPHQLNITPGTNAQGCALARVALIKKWELWSLNTQAGQAQCLTHPNKCPLPFGAPPLLTQARVVGGPLHDEGKEIEAADRKGLRLLARLLAFWLHATPNASIPWHDLSTFWSPLGSIDRNGWVRFQEEKAKVRIDRVGGYWFEFLVGAALLDAGADEVRVGVKWQWPKRAEPRTDADVLVRWGYWFLAVSCKVGSVRLGPALREIEAVASSGVGRFAIPILAKPRTDPTAIKDSLQARKGAVLLDLQIIVDPERLRETIERIVRVRRTTS